MLVVSRLDENTALYIDAEVVGGVDKSEMETFFHPDDTLDDVVALASGIGSRLAEAAQQIGDDVTAPSSFEVEFSLKVDSNATIAVARNLSVGQFKFRVVWNR